ncbi:lysozyme-like [Centruroides vittatus]|uniref:lysozyme-like n=1 Tax=Centruroides vittatus TaxID=120091 RepID=UPI003510A9EC
MKFLLVFVALLQTYCQAKIYDRCELARELLRRFHFSRKTIGHWICLVEHESSYNTAGKGEPNWDGSYDHGLFQINDRYWCSPPHHVNECNVRCSDLRTDDISIAVKCAKKIFEVHNFYAWVAWKNRCQNTDVSRYVSDCHL